MNIQPLKEQTKEQVLLLKALSLLADINGSYLTKEKCGDLGGNEIRNRSLSLQGEIYKLLKMR